MSSRALRRLHGDKELGDNLDQLENEEDDDAEEDDISQESDRKARPVNPFELLQDDEGDADLNDDTVQESNKGKETGDGSTSAKSAKKKKKKKKKGKGAGNQQPVANAEDDIDSAIQAVKAQFGDVACGVQESSVSDGGVTHSMRSLLTVEHRCLSADNEMKKMFGTKVVQGEINKRRGRNRATFHRATWLATPKDTWPQMAKSGLSMSLLDSKPGSQYFAFDHNAQYQRTQAMFLDAVESMQPEAIMNVVNVSPYHIDSLLQLSEICKMSEDVQMATELIERALYACENCFHPSFSLTQGNCRLDYKRPENRSFYLALFRHLVFIGQRGCYRTAMEFCKLILSFDPDGDPLCMLLMLDFYAIRASEYRFLLRVGQEWEAHRNLSQLPNFAYSVALAMFHLCENGETKQADEKLQEALIAFPGLLIPLLDRCNVVPDPTVASHAFFGSTAQTQQPPALKQLVALYVGRCYSVWKEPEVLTWLERNCHAVMKRADSKDPALKQAAKRRMSRYQGTPRNVLRHIVIAEIKEAMTTLPPEISATPILSYDPLPPADSIVSYTRPHRARRGEEDGNPLSLFFRSLLPNFNPQEIVEPPVGGGAEAAAGRPALQQGVGALMDAMRELLVNIQPAPPPVEQHGNGEDDAPAEGDQEWD